MSDNRQWLIEKLNAYTGFTDEYEHISKIMTLEYLRHHSRAFWRDEFVPGHLTSSAWIVNPSRTKVLMMYHKYIQKWLQFGGHADGNPNLVEVALKEASEETGLDISLFEVLMNEAIFDVAIVPVPANPKKNEPDHVHFDIRFLLELDDAIPLPENPEGLDVRWLEFNEAHRLISSGNTCLRMLEKSIS
ncbi:MAG: NUDIX hydrolase [Alphaproteobacteria bacterium]